MPTAPILIPLIIAGLMLGSLLASQTRKLSKKKLLGVSAVAGFLNMADAYLVYTLFPASTYARFGGGGFTGGSSAGFTGGSSSGFQFRAASSEGSFLILSFITGLVIVLAVVGIALAYSRHKVGGSQEESEGLSKLEEEETKLEEETEVKKLEEDIKET